MYKLLGGKIRDRVQCYGNSINHVHRIPRTPQDYAEIAISLKEAEEG